MKWSFVDSNIYLVYYLPSLYPTAYAIKQVTHLGEQSFGGNAAAAPPPFRPSDPAVCGSCPLVTPY